ncbi:MAG TPA: hypothetical protein VMM12_10490 [Longimicrobiales bacterium]|nr:hypothetical protein [Longimicrobiales bacterium]
MLAPNARLRARVVALRRYDDPPGPTDEAHPCEAAPTHEDSAHTLTGAAARSRWAQLLARIYEAFPLRCPECGSDMRSLAFLTDPGPVGAILRHLDLPHPTPTLARPRSAPGLVRI